MWHTAPDVANERLSYPVTYWNTLGLLAALGIVLAFHLTCTLQRTAPGPRPRRGGPSAARRDAVLHLLARGDRRGRRSAWSSTCSWPVPAGCSAACSRRLRPRAALIVVAYHANLLDTVDPTTPAAVSQGHRVALAAGRLRGRVRRSAPGLRARPGSPSARAAGRALMSRQDEARRDRGRRRGGPGARPRARRSLAASRTTGTGSSAAPPPTAPRATCASA